MRRFFVALALVIATGSATADGPDIDAERLIAHIRFLASDDMKGRANGSAELERASEYIASQFESAGLQPGSNGGWYQPFELDAGVRVGAANSLSIAHRNRVVNLELGASYYPLGAPTNDDPAVPSTRLQRLPVVFAGYGLVAPSVGYDDYAKVDVTGKAVLIFSHEPQENEPRSALGGTRPMPQTTLDAKAAAAQSRGAKVLIVVGDPSHRADDANYGLFRADPDTQRVAIPVLRARRTEMQPLIDAWGLDGTARLIDKDLVPRSRLLEDATVDYVEHLAHNRRTVRNVVAVLPGSNPARATEAVVIGAHYDHVGIGGRLSVTPERTGEIHNGADDNASGTAAIVEIARVAAQDRARFPRTLIFIAFAGEERGLLGSAHYASAPTIAMDRTIAMLNLDMVGRSRGGVDVSGLELSPSLEADLKTATAVVGDLDIRRQGPGAGRSDDSSFIQKRVPAVNFFTGFHADYHRPSDDWDKIDKQGTKRVARLALELAARLAARETRPEFIEPRGQR